MAHRAGAAYLRVVPRIAADEDVVAAAAVQHGRTQTADEQVASRAALQRGIAAAANENVVAAGAPLEDVVLLIPNEDVIGKAPDDVLDVPIRANPQPRGRQGGQVHEHWR